MTMPVRTRFAPSPTGRLHIGHAHAADEAFGFAQRHGGSCLLRIEDIDHTRCKPTLTDGIYEDLRWLGHNWPTPPRVQSQYYTEYADVVIDLLQRGFAYPCTLTRSEIKAGQMPNPGRALALSVQDSQIISDYSLQSSSNGPSKISELIANQLRETSTQTNPQLPFSIRLNLKQALNAISDYSLIYTVLVDPTDITAFREVDARAALTLWAHSEYPDPIIARRDIGCSYHIAVTHDDHLQDITHIVRGADFIDQTPLHVLIQALMGWRTPIYYHHPLITDATGRKLSKSARDLTLASLRENGVSPADVLSRAAQQL